jgi:CelD/BcsL family acetyltransferase involved in cellulose biosynthesis
VVTTGREEAAPAATADALGAPGVTVAEWDALAQRSGNVFATREWLSTWQQHEPGAAEVLTIVSRRPDGTLAALLPLVRHRHRRRPTVLRPQGPWPTPQSGLICAPEDGAWAATDVARQLAGRGGWDVLELDAVPEDQAWAESLPTVTLGRQPDRVIDLAGRSWEELLAAAKRDVRAEIRRRGRRLQERHTVRFRMADQQSLDADVDLFLELHRMRWGERVNVLTPARASFLHDFARQALELGWLALWFLELDGRPVATNLNYRYGGNEVFFLAGTDPAFRSDGVGLVMHFHAVKEASAARMAEFHLLRGTESYKGRLPNRERSVGHLALSGSTAGSVAVRAWSAERRLRQVARRTGVRRRLRAAAARTRLIG